MADPSIPSSLSIKSITCIKLLNIPKKHRRRYLYCIYTVRVYRRIMVILSLQVHYPLWPTGTHARGLAGGAVPHRQEPAGLRHRNEGRDSPLNPVPSSLYPECSTPWPLTSKPLLGQHSSLFHTDEGSSRAKSSSIVNVHYVSVSLRNNLQLKRWPCERQRELPFHTALLQEDAWRVPHHQRQLPSHTHLLDEHPPIPSNQRTERPDWFCERYFESQRLFYMLLYTISFQQGWSCPHATSQVDFLSRLLLPKVEGLKRRATTPSSAVMFSIATTLSEFLAFTWALFLIYYKYLFRSEKDFLYEHKLFYDRLSLWIYTV